MGAIRLVRYSAVLGFALTIAGCGPSSPDPDMSAPEPVVDEVLSAGEIDRVDARFDDLVPTDARIEKLADGFQFTEGPIWIRDESRLLFSDIRDNTIYQWTEAEGASVFMRPVFEGDQTGRGSVSSNGLTLDAEGLLVMCEHGNRQVARLEADGTRTVLADRYDGRQLNSPNDAVYASDGSLYSTDPPYGLADAEASPLRELDFNGIYRLHPDGELELLYRDQSRPNGIALSPDESTLYVANSDANQPVWMAYDLGADGVSNPRVFYDVTGEEAQGAADGMKVDTLGNLFATGPRGGSGSSLQTGRILGRFAPTRFRPTWVGVTTVTRST